jgi:hypothetical protein
MTFVEAPIVGEGHKVQNQRDLEKEPSHSIPPSASCAAREHTALICASNCPSASFHPKQRKATQLGLHAMFVLTPQSCATHPAGLRMAQQALAMRKL